MSEHHSGEWGTREDAICWPGGISSTEQQTLHHHQHLINLHQRQQQVQLQHPVAVQQHQHQNDSTQDNSTTSTPATQQLFLYKIENNLENPVTTMSSTAPTTQWWYAQGDQNALDNSLQQQQTQQHQSQTHVQNNLIPNKMVTGTVAGGKVKDNKPKGRMTAYSYFVQMCREEHNKKDPDQQIIFGEFSRNCAGRWKTMFDKEKERFHEMAEKDKARYELEMQSYVPPTGTVVGRGKKRKQFKDPNAPKRPLSVFLWFCHDERHKIRALNPEYGIGDIAKELGRLWAGMDAELRHKYEQMAEKDKQRYEKEMTEYKMKREAEAEEIEQGGGTPVLNLTQ